MVKRLVLTLAILTLSHATTYSAELIPRTISVRMSEPPAPIAPCAITRPGVFLECLHRNFWDACQTSRCIENILLAASCSMIKEDAPNDCNMHVTDPPATEVRQIGRTHSCLSDVKWHTWKTLWYARNAGADPKSCTSMRYRVRCDTDVCDGDPFEPDSFVGVRHDCDL
jgi:hypothetical protein